MKYLDIWKKTQQREIKRQVEPGVRLPNRVKDWPPEAREAFRYTKNELWKWAKDKPGRDKVGLALLAYEAVKQAFESEYEIIQCNTEEETWDRLKSMCGA